MSNQLPEGYKQTEIGVIPEDGDVQQLLMGKKNLPGFSGEWQKLSINKHASLKARIGWQALTTKEYLDSGSFFLVTGTDFIGSRVNWDTCHFVDEWRYSQDKNIQLKNGDVLLTKDGTIGKVGYVESLVKPATLNSGVFVIRPLSESFEPLFLYYILSSRTFDDFLAKIFAGSTISHLYQKDFLTFEFLAPEIEEQRSLAQALSDVDALIAALDKLIAKKRDLKTATMQQLLTGKKRLPGFSGEWKTKLFSEIASCRKERLDPRKLDTQEFCVELEHIESSTGRLLGSTQIGQQSSLKVIFQPGDVLFGKLRSYLRKYWFADCKGVCSTEIWVLVANSQLATSKFLYQVVTLDWFIEAASTAYGTHMPRADWNIIKNCKIAIPTIEEQRAIATVLSDMDNAISALESRLTKTKAIKQGMMQELLSGRTRLV